jgi:hypothetical protein
MIYWFAGFPDRPVHLPYTAARFEMDTKYLAGLIDLVEKSSLLGFVSGDGKTCPRCVYRSLCDRGVEAGGPEGLEEQDDLDLGTVDEIAC